LAAAAGEPVTALASALRRLRQRACRSAFDNGCDFLGMTCHLHLSHFTDSSKTATPRPWLHWPEPFTLGRDRVRVPEFGEFLKSVRSISGRTRDVSDRRNRIVHDPWYLEEAPGTATAQFKSMPKEDLYYGIKDVDKTEINQTLDAIKSIAREVDTLRTQLSGVLNSSRKKPA
jgi:hypothetical protein